MGFGTQTDVMISNGNTPNNGRNRRPLQPIRSRAGWIFPLCIGLAFAGLGMYFVVQSMRSSSWPTVSATVVDVTSDVDTDTDGQARMKYITQLEYTVNGEQYQKRDTSTTRTAEGDTKEYKYNPSNPADTVEPSSGWLGYIFGIVGLVLAIFAAIKMMTFKKVPDSAGVFTQATTPFSSDTQPTPRSAESLGQAAVQPSGQAGNLPPSQQPQQLPVAQPGDSSHTNE